MTYEFVWFFLKKCPLEFFFPSSSFQFQSVMNLLQGFGEGDLTGFGHMYGNFDDIALSTNCKTM